MLTLRRRRRRRCGTPLEAHELAQDLAGIDELLGEPGLLRPIAGGGAARPLGRGWRPANVRDERSVARRLAQSARARARP
jgi:hypothetical protein